MYDLIGIAVVLLIVAWIVGGALWIIGKGLETAGNVYRWANRDPDAYKHIRSLSDRDRWDE